MRTRKGLIALVVALLAAVSIGLLAGCTSDKHTPSPIPTTPPASADKHAPTKTPVLDELLKADLEDNRYTLKDESSRWTEGYWRHYQVWTSDKGPDVELDDFGTGTFRIHSLSYPAAGQWKSFVWSPAMGETLIQAINFSTDLREELASGKITPLQKLPSMGDDEDWYKTSLGTLFMRRSA